MPPGETKRLCRPPIMILSPGQFRWPLVLLAVPLLLAAGGTSSDGPILYNDGFVKVVSQDKVSRTACQKAAEGIRAAWNFDLDQMQWSDPSRMKSPITLRLLSADRLPAGIRARASADGHTFTMRTNLLDDPSESRTLAHELGHLQAFRVLGKRAGKHAVPLYFLEGHGQIMNKLYAEHQDNVSRAANDKAARTIMSLSPDEARTILTDDSYSNNEKDPGKTFKMECLGLYFIEYMRVRYHDKGFPDMVARMARLFERVGGGESYEQAFKHVYGGSLSSAVSEIVALFERTADHPAERLTGTRLARGNSP